VSTGSPVEELSVDKRGVIVNLAEGLVEDVLSESGTLLGKAVICPKCGSVFPLDACLPATSVVSCTCPNCGTEPFERQLADVSG
jgi:predicted RNA-binding Zn-ribbon protein involved in translation (DUF1610 family)